MDDLLHEISETAARGERVLVTTLTKRMAEDLTGYYRELGVRVRYLHSDIDTIQRMQIIRDLEPSGRGLYAGAVGYLDFAGTLDFCIAIRTILMSAGKAYVQAGAGIVIDSNPTAEYEETRDKAKALLRALELAQTGL